ncbi:MULTISPECIES: hypothetical protein [Nautiliaceae]
MLSIPKFVKEYEMGITERTMQKWVKNNLNELVEKGIVGAVKNPKRVRYVVLKPEKLKEVYFKGAINEN